ncbi:MAG: phosphotransferase [Planctomycetota bacterium]|nr:phosphotransferase [Planctomycetota bacterium]MDG2143082.1 phosphotransferase [Planctomycetota bacterium]
MNVQETLKRKLKEADAEAHAALATLAKELGESLSPGVHEVLLAEALAPTRERAWRETAEEWLLSLSSPDSAKLAQLLRPSRGAWLLCVETPQPGTALLIGNSLSGTTVALARLGWTVTLVDNDPARLAIAKMRTESLVPENKSPVATHLCTTKDLPLAGENFDLVVMEEAPPGSSWTLRQASQLVRGAGQVGNTSGMLAVTADNRLAYKVSTGERGEFRLVRPLPFLKRALFGDRVGRPYTPTSSRTLRAHRRAFRDLGSPRPKAVSLYPDRRDFSHVVDLDAPGTLRLTLGPKERGNRSKMLGQSLGLFPVFTPSFALWSPVTIDGIVPRVDSGPMASLSGRILTSIADNFGAQPPPAEHLVATRGNTAMIFTGGDQGWVVRVPLGHRPGEAVRLGLRHTNWLGGRFPKSKLESVLPRPLFEGHVDGAYVVAETRMPGFGAGQLSGDPAGMGRVFTQAGELLAELVTEPPCTFDDEAFDGYFGAAFEEVSLRLGRGDENEQGERCLPANLQRIKQELRALVVGLEIPRVAAHNDLRPKHVIVQAEVEPGAPEVGTIRGIVDWSCLTPNGLPLFDLVHLILQERASCSSSRDAWEDLQNPDRLTAVERAALDDYCAALNLPDAWRQAICLGYPILFGAVAERHWEYSRPHWLRRAFGI